jgi:hypothetical protein
MRCDAMRCDAMRCDAMRCDAMRCDAMLCCAHRCGSPPVPRGIDKAPLHVATVGYRLDVFDKDVLTDDDFLGAAIVPLDALRAEREVDFREPLNTRAPRHGERGGGAAREAKWQGHLLFSAAWAELDPRLLARGVLRVTLARATNLKAVDLGGTSDPCVLLRGPILTWAHGGL